MWLEDVIASTLGAIRPAEKLTVSEWASKYRYLKNQGSFVGFWDHDKTPYMREPMDVLTSLSYTGMVFAGPARTGKTDSFFNWLGHTAACDPADMIYYAMTQSIASEWSQRDLMNTVRAKPPGDKQSVFQRLMRPGKSNIYDKWFKSGMQVMIRWPSITELSGKTVPRVWLADYDRMDQDVEKQGNPFDLARKRTTTYKRFGMTAAEGSPGFEISDPNWLASDPHEAPPTKGILELYNRGDRRRWYWQCPDCMEAFEPTFDLLSYPDEGDFFERAEKTTLVCPHCGVAHEPDRKYEMNRTGRWLREGERWNADGTITGKPRRSDIASFWLNGAAAAFQDWSGLVLAHLQAMDAYEKSGDTGPLKKTMNTDRGEPFVAPRDKLARLPEDLKSRAEDWGSGHFYDERNPSVPPWVRFLVATIDVQARSFVVQINGIGEGGDVTFIDMFKIRKSNRIDPEDRRGEHAVIDPAGYLEDWDLLIAEVIERTYPLNDGSGRRMAIKITGCDSGGRAGTTVNAYNFWRRLRDDDQNRGHHRRFHLIKGEPSKSAPRRSTTYPDSNRKDRNSGARGDVPVQLLNSNLLKDQVYAVLGRTEPPGMMLRFPIWAPNWVYKQLTAEERTSKGWDQKSGTRNETFDLTYYCFGLMLHPDIRIEHLDWSNPPSWAQPWDTNSLVIGAVEKSPMVLTDTQPIYDLTKIAEEMA